jgi:pimeloyl-ACP methyl ester carboxylesterase
MRCEKELPSSTLALTILVSVLQFQLGRQEFPDERSRCAGYGTLAAYARPCDGCAAGAGAGATRRDRRRRGRTQSGRFLAGMGASRVLQLDLPVDPAAAAAAPGIAGGLRQQGTPRNSIAHPLVIGWGRRDRVCFPRQARRALALFPDARLHWFDRCGHFPHWDAPAETAQLILSALAGARANAAAGLERPEQSSSLQLPQSTGLAW